MRPESFARGDRIVVEHPQGAEMDSPGVVISGKTERMVGIEPTMVGVSARLCAVNRLIHSNDFLLYNRLGVKQTPRQPRLRAAPDGIRRLHLQKDVLSVKEIESRVEEINDVIQTNSAAAQQTSAMSEELTLNFEDPFTGSKK
jgi:hypothetical protein